MDNKKGEANGFAFFVAQKVDGNGKKCYNVAMKTKSIIKTNTEANGRGFLKKNSLFFLAPMITFTIYLVQLLISGVAPFTKKHTVASYDLSAQIVPFIEHLFDVLQGKSTLNYSYAIVGGADVTGTFLYFFLSPFSFLFLLFGDGKVAYATGIVMVAKLMTITFAGTWFAKKLFQKIPDYLCIAVGVVYTYCGYTFVANTYINWLDFLIYMPFLAGAFKRFVQTGKFLTFSVLLSCCIYTCFSIACFSMFTAYPLLVGYGILCVEKERRNAFVAYLSLSFLVALLFSLPVLLPAFGAFMRSARGGGLFENIWNGFQMVDGVPTLLNKKQFIDDLSTSMYKKWSYILSDGIFVALTICWFYRNSFKKPFVRFMLVAGIVTLLPTVVDESMLLLNMGSYMQYSLRFGFLNALYFLGGACLCLDGYCYESGKDFEGKLLIKTPLKNKNKQGRYALKQNKEKYLLLVLGGVCLVLTVLFVSNGNYKSKAFWGAIVSDSDFLSAMSGFSSAFAHTYGGLEVVLILFLLVGLPAAFCGFLVGERKVSLRFCSILLLCIVGVQTLFYNNQLVVGNLSTQHTQIGYYQTLSNTLNEREDGYFRIKDYGETRDGKLADVWTVNVPFSGNSNSFSVFSSVIDKDNFVVGNLFEYLTNGKNNLKSTHNEQNYNRSEVFGDSFLGYKYFFVPSKQVGDVEKKSYLQQVMIEEDGSSYPLKITMDKEERYHFYVFENKAVFPSAYRVDTSEPFRFVAENTGSTNRKKNQAALYKFLRGEELKTFMGSEEVTIESATALSEYLWERSAQIDVGAGKITARVKNAQEGESLFLNFVASKGYEVKVNGKKASLIDNDLKFLQVALEAGENEVEFIYHSPYVRYFWIGVAGAVITLLTIGWIVKKSKFMQKASSVISWCAISLSAGILAFFMIFPICVWTVKWIFWIL